MATAVKYSNCVTINLREMTADIPQKLIAIKYREREMKSLRLKEPQATAESISQGTWINQKSAYILSVQSNYLTYQLQV